MLSLALSSIHCLPAAILHQEVPAPQGRIYTWEQTNLTPFDQLIICWNGQKPTTGSWKISVQIFQDGTWQQAAPYMTWAGPQQGSFDIKAQDTIDIPKEATATGFRAIIEGVDGANLRALTALHAYTKEAAAPSNEATLDQSIRLSVAPLSQIALQDPISERICSPTSTLATVRYLLNSQASDPLTFAGSVYDKPADLYGNWVLNVAEASHLLGPNFRVYAARKVPFQTIISQLQKGIPVVVSIKGPITGGARPYLNGHLLVVTGYDPVQKRVHVMDPAFPTDQECTTSYALEDFLEAWGRRGQTAYLFERKST